MRTMKQYVPDVETIASDCSTDGVKLAVFLWHSCSEEIVIHELLNDQRQKRPWSR